jgi:hypothetical protein
MEESAARAIEEEEVNFIFANRKERDVVGWKVKRAMRKTIDKTLRKRELLYNFPYFD